MDFNTLLVYIVCYFGLFTSIFFLLVFYDNKERLRNPGYRRYPKVSVMVPVFNEEKTIRATLESLLKLDYPKEKLEIVVINDASTDNTREIVEEYKMFGVKLVNKKKGEGKGYALNVGLDHVTGELVGCLDADSYVEPDALRKMIGFFDKKGVMAVTPSMKVWKPKNVLQHIVAIEFLFGIFLRKVFAYINALYVTPGPFTIFKKEFFDKHGKYEATNITEDMELALRIQSKGYKIENSADAVVWSKSPGKFKPLLMQRTRWYRGFIDNMQKYKHLMGKDHGVLGMFILPTAFISIVLVILAISYAIFKISLDNSKHLVNWYNINFDLSRILEWNLDFFYLNMDSTTVLMIMTFFFTISLIYLGRRISKDEMRLGFVHLLYFVFYAPLFAIWWTWALRYKATGKKIRWGNKLL